MVASVMYILRSSISRFFLFWELVRNGLGYGRVEGGVGWGKGKWEKWVEVFFGFFF